MTSPHTDEENLSLHREAIDRLDDQLLTLLNERAQHAQAIGLIKKHQDVWRPNREAQILERICAANQGPLSDETLAAIYRQVMSACRALEKQLRIAYLGPAGTFSEQAVLRQFGDFTEPVPCPTVDAALRSAEKGETHYCVLPIENSTEGAVGHTHDLMIDTSLSICAEIKLRIKQNLLASDPDIAHIEKVYSHPQSLAQCAGWLSLNLPHATRVPVSSNAEAARLAAAEANTAAIAGETAANRFQLNILHEHIEDMPNNTTRFWVMGQHTPAPSGKDLTSLILAAPNQPGAMFALLQPLANNGISMTRLESRPSRVGMWEYFFFIDIEGHRSTPAVKTALQQLAQVAPFMKVLGSYPAAKV